MTVTAPPNYPLPTNTQVVFKIEVPRAAHVYLFQVDAQKRVSVLFPDDRIAVKNPLSGGTSVVIPTEPSAFGSTRTALAPRTCTSWRARGRLLPSSRR